MVAYFSMEVALDSAMPTYAGGLGVLAGDFVHAAADLGVPVVAVTLLHRKGYFRQRLDGAGRQHEEALDWPIERFVQPLPARIMVSIGGRQGKSCSASAGCGCYAPLATSTSIDSI